MSKITSVLKDLGIEDVEIKIYMAALEGSPCSVIDLAKRTGMKRTSVYNFINGMIQKGIILPTPVGRKFLYSAAIPEDLVRLLDKKKERLMEIIPELSLMFTKSGSRKPKIRFYEGIEGIKQVYNDTIEIKIDEMLYYSANAEVFQELSETFFAGWIKRRVKKGIFGRGIVPSDDVALRQQKDNVNKKEMRETIVVPQSELPIENEMLIYADKVALLSFGEEKLGVIIESRQIANLQRSIFNLLWKNLKKK